VSTKFTEIGLQRTNTDRGGLFEHELLKSSFPAFPTTSGNGCERGLFCIVLSSLAEALFSSLVGASLLFYEHGLISGC